MSFELRMLAWSVVLGLFQVLLAAQFSTLQRGIGWNMGARDEPVPPLKGVAGRLDRASRNFLETFPFFAAAVLIAEAADRTGALTWWGVQLYFWGRVVYLPVYALGVPGVRSAIWLMATFGLVLVLAALV